MKLEEFIGNTGQIQYICEWLNSYFHEPNVQIPNYCIIQGTSGNGKSTLPIVLANEFQVELFTVTPLDSLNINDIVKSINTKTLDGSNYKLILIDDLDEFPARIRKQICKIPEISNHPIIYTCKVVNFSKDFINGSLRDVKGRIIRLDKPLTSELLELLKSKSNLPIETLDKIARESKSVRSAILSIQTQNINTLLQSSENLFWDITHRKINKCLDRYDIYTIFRNIKGYDKDTFQVMKKFAEFDYRCCGKYEIIDSFFVNEMIEPIENIKFQFKKSNNNKKKKPKKIEKVVKEEKVENKKPTINQWI